MAILRALKFAARRNPRRGGKFAKLKPGTRVYTFSVKLGPGWRGLCKSFFYNGQIYTFHVSAAFLALIVKSFPIADFYREIIVSQDLKI